MRLAQLAGTLILASAAGLGSASVAAAETAPKPMMILIYEPGPAWQPGKPPQEQNLQPHFDYLQSQFREGLVVAFGTQADVVRGYYVLDTADIARAKTFMDNDPALQTGLLKKVDAITWSVLINGFADKLAGDQFFLLRYTPGASWRKGAPLTAQNVGEHVGYMKQQAEIGVVVAAGPNAGADEGLYVIRAADAAAAETFIAADPGVTAGVFKPELLGWNVIAMQRAR